MAHFARLNNSNIVTDVIIVADEDAPTEEAGQTFLASLGLSGEWRQTSLEGSFRAKYAAIGDTFTGTEFVSPEPDDESI
jgi:hypothetical protein